MENKCDFNVWDDFYSYKCNCKVKYYKVGINKIIYRCGRHAKIKQGFKKIEELELKADPK
jgi:hypothetical protein